MDIYSVIKLLGGLAFFLYGMKVLSDGLEKSSNGKIDKYLNAITKNRFLALIFGAVMTIAVQSSSAVTVMLVGLVNSGLMQFGQTIGVLMGSNIGTTLTAWILSLAGIDSDVVWLNLLKPANFAPIFALIGIIMMMASKKQKAQSTGSILIGFAVLMSGMTMMSDAMEPLADMPEFASLLTAFTNPLLAVIVGAVFTGIIQSSAASVAILQALSMTGSVTYGMAIPIIMGQNIGTCVTAILSSIGVSKNAKKVAVVHISFNLIGTIVCLIPFCIANYLFEVAFLQASITPFMIAIVHSIFNVFTTLILFPFAKQLEKIANFVIKDAEKEVATAILLDDRLLTVPTLAVKESFVVVMDMCTIAKDAVIKAGGLLTSYTEEAAEEIHTMESQIDRYEDQLGTFMLKVSQVATAEMDAMGTAKILHTIDDFERIGDHAVNIVGIAEELYQKQKKFSKDAMKEITVLQNAVSELLHITVQAYETNDMSLARSVEPLEQVIDALIYEMKRKHVRRVKEGNCTIKLGFAFNDLLTDYERIADHCSNIGVAVIEATHGTYEPHEYLDSIKAVHGGEFDEKFKEYGRRFFID